MIASILTSLDSLFGTFFVRKWPFIKQVPQVAHLVMQQPIVSFLSLNLIAWIFTQLSVDVDHWFWTKKKRHFLIFILVDLKLHTQVAKVLSIVVPVSYFLFMEKILHKNKNSKYNNIVTLTKLHVSCFYGVAEIRKFRWMCGKSKKERTKNENIWID